MDTIPRTTPSLALTERSGLPDALRVLVDSFPREIWEGHENFGPMVRFWLERHLMFRQLLERLETDSRHFLDRKTDLEVYAPRLARFGGLFLNELHAHHQIEDAHYFPRLVALDRRLEHGFDMLETDHEAIDGLLHAFADDANRVLGATRDPAAAREAAGAFHDRMAGFRALLERHLADEEDLVVPVILKSGFEG